MCVNVIFKMMRIFECLGVMFCVFSGLLLYDVFFSVMKLLRFIY